MESAQALKLAELANRKRALLDWLESTSGDHSITLHSMVGDASFRRYFRIDIRGESYVVMDAPPPQENCRPFVAISKALREIGLNTPDILEADLEQGFLLLTDFGDKTYLSSLNTQNANHLYTLALEALSSLQTCRFVDGHTVPPFTADFMWKEWAWHKEWFLDKFLKLNFHAIEKDLDRCYEILVNSAVNQPQVFMHRDYHSANLMVLPEDEVGILDFQDAFIGPVTYDLVSLLRDCYIDWPSEQVIAWVKLYKQKLTDLEVLSNVSETEFLRWFNLMGIQRHLKALLTFARKHVRDHQSSYLQFIPRTLNYLHAETGEYSEVSALHEFLRNTVQPAIDKALA